MSTSRSSRSWPFFLGAGVLLIALFASTLDWRPRDTRPIGTPADLETLADRDDLNVLFVLIDTLRAERLGAYGYERDTSPTFDELASTGIRFARHLAQSSWTKASMASLWTGLYPQRTRVLRYNDVLSQKATLPAEILRDAGFATVGLWRNGWVAPNFGFEQGFDVYHRPAALPLRPEEHQENPTLKLTGSDESILESMRSFLFTAPQDERWLLYLHLMDVHQYTYDKQSAIFGSTYSDIYDNSIRREDGFLNEMIGMLMEVDQLDRTLIVIASDHGEAFGERGFEGHAQHVYAETTEVPWLIVPPFKLERGIVVESRTRNIDVWPTLLDLLGLPEMEGIDGRSVVPEILAAGRGDPPSTDAEPSFSELDRHWGHAETDYLPTASATLDGHRYVYWAADEGEKSDSEALFDRRSDAAELKNLIGDPGSADIERRLREAVAAYLKESAAPPWGDDAPTVELDSLQLNQLRALGYKL